MRLFDELQARYITPSGSRWSVGIGSPVDNKVELEMMLKQDKSFQEGMDSVLKAAIDGAALEISTRKERR